ncbi:hypothetical protein EVAR_55948_1 [Eumeta japonica]|uniref:Uncharacterized protein n=1 Tax=Eumeta variegata TaxID=151549 RepID=A0A4C1YW81_EUMVA|nr:hypothetical protein EVAR_55948_1 [Eumeta japonica]
MDICKRFDFSDRLFSLISIVNPSVAQQFEIKSLGPVLQRFPVLNNFVKVQNVDDEWRAHALLNFSEYDLNVNDTADIYWSKVCSPELGKTVERMLVGRLQWHLMPKLQATQYSFTPQRGMEDAL